MSERKHADLLGELVDDAAEDEIDRAATVGVARAEAELKAAGFDVAAERAKAGAFADATRRKRPRAAVVWLAAAATFALAGGALYATPHAWPERVSWPPPWKRSAGDLAIAADLRHKAAAACDAKQWTVCLAELDEARAVDPDGDAVLAVKSLRDKAMAGSGERR